MKLRFEVECGPDEPAEEFYELVNAHERLSALRAAVNQFSEALRAVSKYGGTASWSPLLTQGVAGEVRAELYRLLDEHGASLEGGAW